MKEVTNISLQGISFSVEQDALEQLEMYLEELRNHYGASEAEVVNDIEVRIAELLVERGCKESVVQYHHIDEIINILGRPGEIEGEDGSQKGVKMKKRVFRDPANGIVAGVCSGLGAYWNMDAVWIRVLFFAVSFLVTAPMFSIGKTIFGIEDMGWAGFMLVVYCVMWFIIPPARTVAQRCQMRGEPQNVDHIHKKFAQGARNAGSEMWQVGTKATGTFFSGLWKLVCFCAGVLLAVSGFGGIVALGIGFLGVDMVMGFSILALPDFIELNIGNTIWLKIFGVLAVLLPCVGMLYAGLKLCFNFQSPKWRPGLTNFLVWVVSVLMFILLAIKAASPYFDVNSDHKERLSITTQNDTIYVVCPRAPGMEQAKMGIDASHNKVELFYLNNEDRKNTSIALYPAIRVRRSAEVEVPYIEATMTTFSKPTIYDDYTGDVGINGIVELEDSSVTIIPAVYSKEHKFSGKIQSIKLYVPDSTTVILKEPIQFTFGESKSYRSGIRGY